MKTDGKSLHAGVHPNGSPSQIISHHAEHVDLLSHSSINIGVCILSVQDKTADCGVPWSAGPDTVVPGPGKRNSSNDEGISGNSKMNLGGMIWRKTDYYAI